MKAIILEGAAEEIIQIINTLQQSTDLQVTGVPQEPQAEPPETKSQGVETEKFVSKEFARQVLLRRQLSSPFKAVLQALFAAGPKYLTTTELITVAGYSNGHQFAGLMGAFGRRKANTPGNEKESYFFEYRWKADTAEWEYRLPDSVREVLEEDNLV